MNEQTVCKTCILPETKTFILNETGNCLLCALPDMVKHISKKPDIEQLLKIIDRIKSEGKDKEYDCIVGWSGGRDSTNMLYELVTIHKLRCIAVFGKTPYTPKEIIDNVYSISSYLKIKLIEITTPKHHKDIAAYCLQMYIKTKIPMFINLACASCKYLNRELFEKAKELGINTIIYGGNRFEYLPFGPASIDINSENRYSFFNMLRDNSQRIFKGLNLVFSAPGILRHGLIFFKASILYINQYSIFFRLFYSKIFSFDYYHYAEWDENKINSTLKKLRWNLPNGCVTTWRADCVFEAVKNAAFKQQLGFTYSQAFYSNLVRSGKITREEALRRIENEPISEPRLKEALRLCGLPEDSFK